MMGYEGGDLLLTGAAWPTVRSLPKPVCAGCGRWPGWPVAPVDESAFEVAWPSAFSVHKNALYLFWPYLQYMAENINSQVKKMRQHNL